MTVPVAPEPCARLDPRFPPLSTREKAKVRRTLGRTSQGPRSGHMRARRRVRLVAAVWAGLAICMGGVGCHQQLLNPAETPVPRELEKASLPPYVIEPPDLLTVDALRLVPL